MPYKPIENYGVIGNLRTAALVGMDGSIDWYCFPNFDSPSIFASVLDDKIGGHFKIAPLGGEHTQKQFYIPETNVLNTTFMAENSSGEVTDFMPVALGDTDYDFRSQWLIRQVHCINGPITFLMECKPAFDYARKKHRIVEHDCSMIFQTDDLEMELCSTEQLIVNEDTVLSRFTLDAGQKATFILRPASQSEACEPSLGHVQSLREETLKYWRDWLSKCKYQGRWREMVYRSALVLKLLTFQPTGAIVAAPTASLPEDFGGERNWDYRFTWMRDASFTVYALMRIGFYDESASFVHWLYERCIDPNPDGSLQIMYGIDGRRDIQEEELPHLEGYKGSRPVRIGNGAMHQMQLDIYGEIMDSIYLYNKYSAPISHDLWTHLVKLVDFVCDHWQEPDCGVWEVRGALQHFVYSKVMCWVTLDRALRLAEKRSFPAPRERWYKVRDEIYNEVLEKGWNPKLRAFTQYYGSENLDASNLIMPLTFFMSPADPRMLDTVDAINRPVEQGGLLSSGLVLRYLNENTDDGLSGRHGTFNLCSFWLVEVLTRAGRFDFRKLNQARLMFERLLSQANHLGLYAEEIGRDGVAQGNFPQAFTHISLISAAYNLHNTIEGNFKEY